MSAAKPCGVHKLLLARMGNEHLLSGGRLDLHHKLQSFLYIALQDRKGEELLHACQFLHLDILVFLGVRDETLKKQCNEVV